MRNVLKVLLLVLSIIFVVRSAAAQSVEFPVERQLWLRSHRGTLRISPTSIDYVARRNNESRSWGYDEIRQFKIHSPTEIEIETYESQRLELGHDRIFKFKLIKGEISADIAAMLIARARRPVASSVIPEGAGSPEFQVPVRHLHSMGGCDGLLLFYSDRVIYQSRSRPIDSRYWRYSDIQSFGHPERYRFRITTFELQAGGPDRTFNFELKKDLPERLYDYVWVRVYPESWRPYPASKPAPSEANQAPAPQPPSGASEAQPRPTPVAPAPAVQSVEVALTGKGYEPGEIKLRPGVLARVTFIRKVQATCGTEIVIPDFNIRRKLPLNSPVTVEFTPDKKGEFVFTCGMGMLRGKILVQESD